MRLWLFGIAGACVAGACGGAAEESKDLPRARSAAGQVAREPIEVYLSLTRVGAAVRLDIEGVGKGVREHAPFENPDRWTIAARQGERRLERMVNGSVAVERRPAGTDQWDTVVRFSVVYRLEGQDAVELRVTPPGGDVHARKLALETIDEGVPEEGSGVEAAAAVDAEIALRREEEAKAAAEAEAKAKAEAEALERKKRKKKKKKRRQRD